MALTGVVTGCSGYIATELVMQLLEKGWNVRGTVRSLKNEEKVAHLRSLDKALPGKLTLHEADLLQEGSFDEVVSGSDVVFHTASPFVANAKDPQREMVDPAVKGTTTVLESAIKSKDTVKRIVLTSSVAAIVKDKKGPSNGEVFTDEDWNDESTLTEGSYRYSKTEAEKAARKLASEAGMEIVTIHPTFVLGPVISKTIAPTVSVFKAILEDEDGVGMYGKVVDVRDVAAAHVRAAEVPGAHGRYILSQSGVHSVKYVAEVLSRRFPEYKFTSIKEANPARGFDTSKVSEELGIKLLPVEITFVDMAVTMIQLGLAKPLLK